MSLDIRTSYLNFFITATIGIAFWYRNIGADRPIGGFLLALSLIFLFTYGLSNSLSPDLGGRLILASLLFSVLLLPLLVNLMITANNWVINLLLIVALIILIWGLFIAAGSSTFDASLCEWKRDGEFLFGSIGSAALVVLLLTLFFLSLLVNDALLMVILLLLVLGTIFLLITTDYVCFGYYFILLLVLLLLIYYFIPFFTIEYEKQLRL